MRHLQRGARLGPPSGSDVARAMGVEPLTPAELAVDDLGVELGRRPNASITRADGTFEVADLLAVAVRRPTTPDGTGPGARPGERSVRIDGSASGGRRDG